MVNPITFNGHYVVKGERFKWVAHTRIDMCEKTEIHSAFGHTKEDAIDRLEKLLPKIYG